MNIIECLNDKKLLGQFIKDPATWKAWFVFLKAFFGLPYSGDEELKIYRECTGRTRWPKPGRADEAWLICGTRSGKTNIVSLIGIFLSIFVKYDDVLSDGERGVLIIVSPTKKQSKIIKKYLSTFFKQNDFFRPYLSKDTGEEIELTNGIDIAVLTNDYRTVRGHSAIGCVIDETAFLGLEDFSTKPDTEILRALRSRTLTTGGPTISLSSAYAKRGVMYEVFKRHFGEEDSNILVWKAPSSRMNPLLDQKRIDRLRELDPEGTRTDFDCEFRDDVSDFISRDIVEDCIIPDRYELPPNYAASYKAFTDPSGGRRDSMTLAIAHSERDVQVLDLLIERRPPFNPDEVTQEFSQVLRQYGITTVSGDKYAGEWPASRFQAHGITYKVSEWTKNEIYTNLLPLLTGKRCELLDNKRLISQLCNLERRTARSGKDSIDHTPGGHDDVCNAAAGALVTLGTRKMAGVW